MTPRTLVASLLMGLALTGCSSDPEPRVSAPPTPSVSPTVSPSSSPSPIAEEETPEEFIQRWFDTGFVLQSSNESTEFLRLSRNCSPCQDLVDSVNSYYADGGYVQPAHIEILEITQPQEGALDFYVKTNSDVTRIKESALQPEKVLQGGAVTYLARLVPNGQSWLMRTFFLEPTS